MSVPATLMGACTRPADPHFRSGALADVRTRYFAARQWAPLPRGGVVIGCNADYRVRIVGAAGQITSTAREPQLIPVDSLERDSFVRMV